VRGWPAEPGDFADEDVASDLQPWIVAGGRRRCIMRAISKRLLAPAAILLASGCASDLGDDEEGMQDEVGQTALALDTDLPLTPFADSVKPYSGRWRDVIRSASEYEYYVGHAPPAWIDFGQEWVAFATTGTTPTDGYEMYIDRARFFTWYGYNLNIYFREVAPGAGCSVNPVPSQADALATFPIPPYRPRRTRFENEYVTADCVP
jgi:hypothetical protein